MKRGSAAISLLVIGILTLAAFFSVGPTSPTGFATRGISATTPIGACGTITVPGNYKLNTSLSSTAICLDINASNVVLDCSGFSITHSSVSNGRGVRVNGDSVTVANCSINSAVAPNAHGIEFLNVVGGLAFNNTINSTEDCIAFTFSNDSSAISNNFLFCEDDGFDLNRSSQINITDNFVMNASDDGVDLENTSVNVNVDQNRFIVNDTGITIGPLDDNISITNNNITSVDDCIRSSGGKNVFASNNILVCVADGIDLNSGSVDSVLINNTITAGPASEGIELSSSVHRAFIKGNTVLAAGSDCVENGGSDNVTVINNILTCTDDGIDLFSGAIDGVYMNNTIVAGPAGEGFELSSSNHRSLIKNNTIKAGSDCVENGGSDNITIKDNVFVSCLSQGVQLLSTATNTIIINNTFNTSSNSFLSDAGSSNSTFSYNRVLGTAGASCVSVTSNDFNTITNNVMNCGLHGLFIRTSTNNLLSNNVINATVDAIQLLGGSPDNLIQNNTLTGGNRAIDISGSNPGFNILNNSLLSTGDDCIQIRGSDNGTIFGNAFSSCGLDGMDLRTGTTNTTISNNNISNVGNDGISNFNPADPNNFIINNTIDSPGDDCIHAASAGWTISGNTMTNCTDDGIFYSFSTRDLLIINNTIGAADQAIVIDDSTGSTNLTISRNVLVTFPGGDDCLDLNNVSNSTFTNNIGKSCADDGVDVNTVGFNLTFVNLTINPVSGRALTLLDLRNSTFTGLFIEESNEGIELVDSFGNSFTNVVMASNNTWFETISLAVNSSMNTFTNVTFQGDAASLQYAGTLNISNQSFINQAVLALTKNNVLVNVSNASFMNTSARIVLRNITLNDPFPIVDFTDSGTFETCSAPKCTPIVSSGNNISFNVSSFTTFSSGIVNLTFTKVGSPNPVLPGGTLTYTVSITNNGGATAQGVTAVDLFPMGVSFVSSSIPASGANDTFVVGNVSPGTTSAFQINVTLDANITSGTVLNNTLQLSTLNTTGGNVSANTTALTTVTVPGVPKSGGGGGGLQQYKTITPSKIPITHTMPSRVWKTPLLESKDQIKFKALGEDHSITVNSVGAGQVSITVASTPKTFTLTPGGFRFVDLNKDSIDDLRIEVLSANQQRVQLNVEILAKEEALPGLSPKNLAKVEAPVSTKTILQDEKVNSKPKSKAGSAMSTKLPAKSKNSPAILLVVLLALTVVAVLVYRKRNPPKIDHLSIQQRINRIKKQHQN